MGLPPGSSSSGCGLLLVSQAGGTCVPLVYTTRNHTHQTHSNESERERGSETRVESGDVLVRYIMYSETSLSMRTLLK